MLGIHADFGQINLACILWIIILCFIIKNLSSVIYLLVIVHVSVGQILTNNNI